MSSAVVVEREPLIGFWGLLLVLCAAGMGYAMWRAQRVRTAAHAEFVERRAAEAAFDPLGFFYQVQQAAMDGDRAMLGGICTGGLADVLAEAPEPGRRARLTLTGVTYRKVMGGYEYRFYDTVQKAQVVEQWVVTCHLLVGITVVEA